MSQLQTFSKALQWYGNLYCFSPIWKQASYRAYQCRQVKAISEREGRYKEARAQVTMFVSSLFRQCHLRRDRVSITWMFIINEDHWKWTDADWGQQTVTMGYGLLQVPKKRGDCYAYSHYYNIFNDREGFQLPAVDPIGTLTDTTDDKCTISVYASYIRANEKIIRSAKYHLYLDYLDKRLRTAVMGLMTISHPFMRRYRNQFLLLLI